MKAKKAYLIIYVVVFALMLALPIVTINREPGKISETEKRYLADFPDIFDQQGHLSGGLRDGLESWLGDNIGFRSAFTKLASNIKLKLLRQSTSDQVEIGRDGWYFYTENSNLDIAAGTYPGFGDDVLQMICRQQERIQEKLAAQGTDYVLILPPSKASIYPEYISSGEYSVTRTPVDILADYLEEHSDVKVVRLKESLLAAKPEGRLYYKTDTHWNQLGAYVGYRETIRAMRGWDLCDVEAAEAGFTDSQFQGEFGAMLGYAGLLPGEDTETAVLEERTAKRVETGERYERLRSLAETEGIQTPFYLFENGSLPERRSVLIFGDSMFAERLDPSFAALMAESFSSVAYVWDYDIRQSIVEAEKPDVVIYEMTERFLNSLQTKNILFVQEPITDGQAEFLGWTEGVGGLEVTVKNAGGSTWYYEDAIRCGILLDGTDTGLRAMLPDEGTVGPGETVTMVFNGVDPDAFSERELSVQMLQEGITYFGEKERLRAEE